MYECYLQEANGLPGGLLRFVKVSSHGVLKTLCECMILLTFANLGCIVDYVVVCMREIMLW